MGGKGGWGGGGKGQRSNGIGDHNRDCTVWIGNIPAGITKDEMQTNFGGAGTVKHIQMSSNGQGLAIFSSAAEATQAIAMFNGADINGTILQVDVWTKKDA